MTLVLQADRVSPALLASLGWRRCSRLGVDLSRRS